MQKQGTKPESVGVYHKIVYMCTCMHVCMFVSNFRVPVTEEALSSWAIICRKESTVHTVGIIIDSPALKQPWGFCRHYANNWKLIEPRSKLILFMWNPKCNQRSQ